MCVGVPCGFHRGLVRSRGRPGGAVAGWRPVVVVQGVHGKEGKFTPQVQIMTTRRNEAVTMCVIYSLDTDRYCVYIYICI